MPLFFSQIQHQRFQFGDIDVADMKEITGKIHTSAVCGMRFAIWTIVSIVAVILLLRLDKDLAKALVFTRQEFTSRDPVPGAQGTTVAGKQHPAVFGGNENVETRYSSGQVRFGSAGANADAIGCSGAVGALSGRPGQGPG
jgi:hypothetical protein